MIALDIPSFRKLELVHLVSDFNGTLALDGRLLPGVHDLLVRLATDINIHVISGDTFGLSRAELEGLPVALVITPQEFQAETKLEYVKSLGAGNVVAIGNGRNDRFMLQAAAIGIALIQREGCSALSMVNADLVSTNIVDALELLLHPKRLVAALGS